MKSLYIIGNGFDLYHGLKTSYRDFFEFILKHSKIECDTRCKIICYLKDIYGEDLWNIFEEALGNPNKEAISILSNINSKRYNGRKDKLIDKQNTLDGIDSDIRFCFTEWINYIKKSPEQPTKILNLDNSDSIFLTFNYTDILESVYGINKSHICYIHDEDNGTENSTIGDIQDVRKFIFGCNIKQAEQYKDDEEIYRFVQELSKDVSAHMKSERWLNLISQLDGVECIYTLGHSIAEVDYPYFEKIKEVIPFAKWYYARTDKFAEDKVKSNLENIGICAEVMYYQNIK